MFRSCFIATCFVINDHHQATVMNVANTVIELSPIRIYISYVCTCCKTKLLLKMLKLANNLRIKLKGNNHVKTTVECEDYEVQIFANITFTLYNKRVLWWMYVTIYRIHVVF
jgi:hypothetical protein